MLLSMLGERILLVFMNTVGKGVFLSERRTIEKYDHFNSPLWTHGHTRG
jgi:hypothetical protein